MTRYVVVLASMETITLAGLFMLIPVVAGVWILNGRFIVKLLIHIAIDESVRQIAASLKKMEQFTQGAAESAQKNANSTQQVSSQSESLDGIVGRLTTLVG
jgi:uncharacterized membrane protein